MYDHKENLFYYMDIACYSWLKTVKIDGFKPYSPKKKDKKTKLPALPILFDTIKGQFLASITEQRERQGREETKAAKFDVIESLIKARPQAAIQGHQGAS